jgi:hypothetical protein
LPALPQSWLAPQHCWCLQHKCALRRLCLFLLQDNKAPWCLEYSLHPTQTRLVDDLVA